jgi:hypothetical protein
MTSTRSTDMQTPDHDASPFVRAMSAALLPLSTMGAQDAHSVTVRTDRWVLHWINAEQDAEAVLHVHLPDASGVVRMCAHLSWADDFIEADGPSECVDLSDFHAALTAAFPAVETVASTRIAA